MTSAPSANFISKMAILATAILDNKLDRQAAQRPPTNGVPILSCLGALDCSLFVCSGTLVCRWLLLARR